MRIIRLDPNIYKSRTRGSEKKNGLLDEITSFLSTDGIMCEFNYNYATVTAIYLRTCVTLKYYTLYIY